MRRIAGLLWLAVLAGCAARPSPLPPPPVHPHGQALWHIVHDLCVPNQIASGNPAPCAEVSIAGGVARGHVLLKDIKGATQYLLMPTRDITGIEDNALLAPDAVDYFAPAWRARTLVEQRFGRRLAREDVSIAVNSIYGRSQDLLHLHIDCIRGDVRDRLRRALPAIGARWSEKPIMLAGTGYRAMRVNGADAPEADPFDLLATGLHVPPREMGAWTLVLTGADFGGTPGFLLLAARADPAHGRHGSGEELQDHACTAQHAEAG